MIIKKSRDILSLKHIYDVITHESIDVHLHESLQSRYLKTDLTKQSRAGIGDLPPQGGRDVGVVKKLE